MNVLSTVQSSQSESHQGWWFAFRENHILVKPVKEKVLIPFVVDLTDFNLEPVRKQYLGSLDGRPCFSAELPDRSIAPDGMTFEGLRGLYGLLDEEMFWLAGRSFQVMNWDRAHQYCGGCGSPPHDKRDDRAKICPQCGLVDYPSASPAIIVAVRKDKQILLARAQRHPAGRYSVLAGFVELGETLEECVRREVKEEVGLEIKNIRYFSSQSWPFPNSLMIGFTAEYAKGEIAIDNNEIEDARWFSTAEIPQVPGSLSIARQLIEWFAANFK